MVVVVVGMFGVLACAFVTFFVLEWRATSGRGIGVARGEQSEQSEVERESQVA